MSVPFWESDPGARWATLMSVVETYCHPEADDDAYDSLRRLAKRPDDEEMRVFKEELRAAVLEPGRLPKGALVYAAAYDDGSDIAFLTRLWRDLYPEEPLPAA